MTDVGLCCPYGNYKPKTKPRKPRRCITKGLHECYDIKFSCSGNRAFFVANTGGELDVTTPEQARKIAGKLVAWADWKEKDLK